jgi:WS/DGAT/MGAT family acyltransferase
MSLLDATFLRIEKRESPMHVATLQLYSLPEGAPADFVRDLVRSFRAEAPLTGPFGKVLAGGLSARLSPALAPADVDLEYHVRHAALPAAGGERELGELVSHLHGVVLDRSRPLWTCHVIEGLTGNRFAIYLKIHHALTDGVGGIRLTTQSLAAEPNGPWSAPWHHANPTITSSAGGRAPRQGGRHRRATCWSLARGVAGLVRRSGAEPVVRPFEAPHSVINAGITGARRVATQQVELARLQRVGRQADASVNDVFLAICSTALRRHLSDSGLLPKRSLVAGVPVSLRQPGDTGANAVGTMWSTLATDVSDPVARLTAIHESMDAAKTHLNSMSPSARKIFTMMTMAPVVAVLMGGLGARVRPPMNVTISNVPGPREPIYLNGARLEACYPVSIPVPGQALNITCVTYDGKFNIGFTGCRDSLPHLQRLAVYAGEALEELEAALAPRVVTTSRTRNLERVG